MHFKYIHTWLLWNLLNCFVYKDIKANKKQVHIRDRILNVGIISENIQKMIVIDTENKLVRL